MFFLLLALRSALATAPQASLHDPSRTFISTWLETHSPNTFECITKSEQKELNKEKKQKKKQKRRKEETEQAK